MLRFDQWENIQKADFSTERVKKFADAVTSLEKKLVDFTNENMAIIKNLERNGRNLSKLLEDEINQPNDGRKSEEKLCGAKCLNSSQIFLAHKDQQVIIKSLNKIY